MSAPPLQIYCINLDHRPDRWTHIQNEVKKTELHISRFPGIYNVCGVTGCRESHFAVIRKAKADNLPWVGIMEDDCAFYDHFASEFPKALASLWSLRDDWEIFNSGPIDLDP